MARLRLLPEMAGNQPTADGAKAHFFVNGMSDLFHENCAPLSLSHSVFFVMGRHPTRHYHTRFCTKAARAECWAFFGLARGEDRPAYDD